MPQQQNQILETAEPSVLEYQAQIRNGERSVSYVYFTAPNLGKALEQVSAFCHANCIDEERCELVVDENDERWA